MVEFMDKVQDEATQKLENGNSEKETKESEEKPPASGEKVQVN